MKINLTIGQQFFAKRASFSRDGFGEAIETGHSVRLQIRPPAAAQIAQSGAGEKSAGSTNVTGIRRGEKWAGRF